MHVSKDLIAASATPLILAILNENDSYGYAIIKRVKEMSENELVWTEGMFIAPVDGLMMCTKKTGQQEIIWDVSYILGRTELQHLFVWRQ